MGYSTAWLAGGVLAALALGAGWAQGTVKAEKTPESLKAEVEALRPGKLAWREIAWKNCPLEALKEAREKKRPVLVWIFLGNPTDERC